MQRTDWKTWIIAGLLGALVTLLATGERPAGAARSTDSNGDMIAVTGEYGNGTSVLYVIDTKSRNLAVYRSLNGTGIELMAARRIDHDLRLLGLEDRTRAGYSPLELEERFDRWRAGKGEAPGAPILGPVGPEPAPAAAKPEKEGASSESK